MRLASDREGDSPPQVWAADPETGEAGARPVTALIEGEGVKDLVTVSTASGSVVATAGHPFWSVSEAAWVDAGDLAVGDAVLEADGATSVVTAVSAVSRQATVHNLTVADLHTYFVVVGDAPTLVHNCGGDFTRVGRWMDQTELDGKSESGVVQVGGSGTTYVSSPASRTVFEATAERGSVYVEFDVPQSALRPGGTPETAQIPSPPHLLYGRLAEQRGEPLMFPVPACNIVVLATKC
ncbi:MAG: polymorphic toxin-type HINT domain-containing protein [Microcella sp.]